VQRSDRVGDEIQRVVADLIQNQIKDPRLPPMVSVVEVRASRDLSHAHIYVSVLGTEQQKKDCAAALRSASGFIRRELTARIRLRVAPELHFIVDESIERGIRMGRLIDEAMVIIKAEDAQAAKKTNETLGEKKAEDTATEKKTNEAADGKKTDDSGT